MAAQSPADTRMTGMLHSHHKGGDDGPGGDAVHHDVRVRQALPAAHRSWWNRARLKT